MDEVSRAQIYESIGGLKVQVEALVEQDKRLCERFSALEKRVPKPQTGEISLLGSTWTRFQLGIAVALLAMAIWVFQDTWSRSRRNSDALSEIQLFVAAGGRATSSELALVAECVALRYRERMGGLETSAGLRPPDETTRQQIADCDRDLKELVRTLRSRE